MYYGVGKEDPFRMMAAAHREAETAECSTETKLWMYEA